MAFDTDPRLQNQVIYCIYVRSHTPEGTFRAVIPDLDRIRDLGADIVWFMPVHPIGEAGRKGSLGCPYANRDYRTVNPEYGTMEDFRALADAIHARGMKVMIDVVYNHTSPDSTLYREHPEFFYRRPDGHPGNRIGDWTDVIDLDYGVPALWDYQIGSLTRWAEVVDGFRCDVASFVPLAFWERARAAVKAVKPDCVWLAETVHRTFGLMCRRNGLRYERDADMYRAFDIEYEYDVRDALEGWLRGGGPLSAWADQLSFQEAVYPVNYNKLRFLENHDQSRIASYVNQKSDLENYTAMLYFLKGTTLIYAGQEFRNEHTPSLFEKEPIARDAERDISGLLKKLGEIKKTALGPDDDFLARGYDDTGVIRMERQNAQGAKLGVFSLRSEKAEVDTPLPDGDYVNLVDGAAVRVAGGRLRTEGRPIILRAERFAYTL